MRKLIVLITISFWIVSCGENSNNESKESNEPVGQSSTEVEVDLTVNEALTVDKIDFVLEFINAYVENCNASEDFMEISDWVNSNTLVTAEFKSELAKMVAEANEEDPEMGLGFDPIFDAQDYPSKGFDIDSFDPETNLVYLKGNEWEGFYVTVKIKKVNGEWLVDGCGAINLPEKDRAER